MLKLIFFYYNMISEVNEGLSDRFLISSYPTLIYFKNNKMHYFEGMRSPELLEKFIKKGYNEKNVTK